MDIYSYVKSYNLPFDKIKTDFNDDFQKLFQEEKVWLGDLEGKLHLLKEKNEIAIKSVIDKLKINQDFTEKDTPNLSIFTRRINSIVKIADRVNNFKEGTSLENDENLKLWDFFNAARNSDALTGFEYNLNDNLNNFLPHIYSVIKHCQIPDEFPIYYKYWKNVMREVLSREDDYDTMCSFYREFPLANRHLNFGTYFGVIGVQIAKNVLKSGLVEDSNSKNYKYLKKDVINIPRYYSILDDKLSKRKDALLNNKQYWLYAPGENARKWEDFYKAGLMGLGWDDIGDLRKYKSRVEIREALISAFGGEGSKSNDVSANDDFLNKMKVGDVVIAKKGRGELLGYGEIDSDYDFDKSRSEFKHIRKVNWKSKGNWKVDFSLVLKTLTDITKYSSDDPNYNKYYEKLLDIMKQVKPQNSNQVISKMIFPLNTILYGPPGTGKTYNTILRAVQIIENRKIESYKEALTVFKANLHNRIEFITFHQNYSYEDFIQGLRPDTENDNQLTFERRDGVFKLIADKALKNLKDSEKPVVPKKSFEETFNQFISPLIEGEVDEIEVKMKKVSFFVTSVNNKSIEFRKSGGVTEHTLSLNTLKKMYSAESVMEIQGLAPYYSPLLEELLKIGKDATSKKEKVSLKNYVIIIDEINRANISRVFGELITLIEPDKRSHGAIPLEARLPSGDPFIVPSNLYIIGTMNTADKSIALLDIALRRRFEFESMYPLYEIEGEEIYDVDILQKINERIISTKGHDFQIGHAYFMGDNKDLVERMNKKVIPLLLEYYMNDEKEVKAILQAANLNIEDKSWPLKISGKND